MYEIKVTRILMIIVIVVLVYYIVVNMMIEGYKNKEEKVKTIYEWFDKNDTPSYKKYQKEIKNSDIVEYQSIKKESRKGELTINKVEKLLI